MPSCRCLNELREFLIEARIVKVARQMIEALQRPGQVHIVNALARIVQAGGEVIRKASSSISSTIPEITAKCSGELR